MKRLVIKSCYAMLIGKQQKLSILSSSKIDKYKYLTCDEIFEAIEILNAVHNKRRL